MTFADAYRLCAVADDGTTRYLPIRRASWAPGLVQQWDPSRHTWFRGTADSMVSLRAIGAEQEALADVGASDWEVVHPTGGAP